MSSWSKNASRNEAGHYFGTIPKAVEELVELHQTFSDGKVLVKQGQCFHSRLLQNNAGIFGQKLQQVLLESFNGLLNLFGSFDDATENR